MGIECQRQCGHRHRFDETVLAASQRIVDLYSRNADTDLDGNACTDVDVDFDADGDSDPDRRADQYINQHAIGNSNSYSNCNADRVTELRSSTDVRGERGLAGADRGQRPGVAEERYVHRVGGPGGCAH